MWLESRAVTTSSYCQFHKIIIEGNNSDAANATSKLFTFLHRYYCSSAASVTTISMQ